MSNLLTINMRAHWPSLSDNKDGAIKRDNLSIKEKNNRSGHEMTETDLKSTSDLKYSEHLIKGMNTPLMPPANCLKDNGEEIVQAGPN